MAVHVVAPERRSLHGHFSRELAPILTIDSGDTVRLSTLEAGWGLEPPAPEDGAQARFEPRDPERDNGHALCGPIAVRGARAGRTLEIEMLAIEPGDWGRTRSGGWSSPLNDRLGLGEGPSVVLAWAIDRARGRATDHLGRSVALRPFMGVIGLAPAEPGVHSTIPPRATGGNIDCRELLAGSRLFLPIAVDGALLSLGDGHAAQGDGEVSGLAIECPMQRVEIAVRVREDLPLEAPIAETALGTLTFGFGETLDDAAARAVDGMLRLLAARHGLARADALALASVCVDLRVTQIVNRIVGVHAVLSPGAFAGA